MELLRLEHIQKYYGHEGGLTQAIRDISFTVEAGEFVGIMGRPVRAKPLCSTAFLRSILSALAISGSRTGHYRARASAAIPVPAGKSGLYFSGFQPAGYLDPGGKYCTGSFYPKNAL